MSPCQIGIQCPPRRQFVTLPRASLPPGRAPDLLRGLHSLITNIESTGPAAPWLFLALFVAASGLMIWRLEAMSASGFEGTVLGTLVMPYCSGIGNLVFAFLLGRSGGPGAEVMTNSLVNNVTNMTLILGVPTIIWGLRLMPAGKKKARSSGKGGSKSPELNRLSLLLTLLAVLFFTGADKARRRRSAEFNGKALVSNSKLCEQQVSIF